MTETNTEQDIQLLLIDDEEIIHKSVGGFLKKMGYRVLHAYSGNEGFESFTDQGADIIISDIRMAEVDGFDLIARLKDRQADVEVILITGHGDLNTAIRAMREGAFDFFAKPIKLEDLVASLQRTQRYQAVRREKDRIQERLEQVLRSGSEAHLRNTIIGRSAAMNKVLVLINKVANAERTTVLIQGESGTGKELVARAVHDQSPRVEAPFSSVNSTAIPDTLFESELFGHEKGAFTDAKTTKKGMFELSNGGTLFLDEIGDMSLQAQAKILRVLEERKIRRVGGVQEIAVDVRLVAATHQDLHRLQEEGLFRKDLYFRLNVFTVQLPPLRDRGDDVLLLADHFLILFAHEFRKDIRHIAPEVQVLLKRYAFPGNIRELRNLIERAVILCEGEMLNVGEFADLREEGESGGEAAPFYENAPLNLGELEAYAIRIALKRVDNNQTEAARLLGIGHDALRYRMKKYGYS